MTANTQYYYLVVSHIPGYIVAVTTCVHISCRTEFIFTSSSSLSSCLGNAAVARSYVSAATTESERTGAFAGISASQAIGFILGPGYLAITVYLTRYMYIEKKYSYDCFAVSSIQ